VRRNKKHLVESSLKHSLGEPIFSLMNKIQGYNLALNRLIQSLNDDPEGRNMIKKGESVR